MLIFTSGSLKIIMDFIRDYFVELFLMAAICTLLFFVLVEIARLW